MKKILAVAVGLIVLGLILVVWKGRKVPPGSTTEVKTFSTKAREATSPQAPSAAGPSASATIDTYIEKHPSGPGVAPLRRLSAALQRRPDQVQALAETAASRIEDGSISQEDTVVLEKAAAMAEQKGLSPREMAEFSRKNMIGMGSSKKPVSALIAQPASPAPLPSFAGKRHLTYAFTGVARCAGSPCTDIQITIRVASGKWVETREGSADGQGQYALQMPVLSEVNEKVRWHLEAYSKDLRKGELNGERVTTGADKDITVRNVDVVLKQ